MHNGGDQTTRPGLNRWFVIWNLMFIFLWAMPGASRAQSLATKDETPKGPTASERAPSIPVAQDTNVDDRLHALEDELRQQKQMLIEMRETIADQRRLIETLSQRTTAA